MTEETMNNEICEECEETVFLCGCQRCEICGTLYNENEALSRLSEEGYCKECHDEENEGEPFITMSDACTHDWSFIDGSDGPMVCTACGDTQN